jgi:integrase
MGSDIMPKLKMSDDKIRGLPVPESPVDYYDDPAGPGGVKGLLIKISAGGARTFYCLYRPSNKKMGSRQHKLGRYPDLKLAAARIMARKFLSAMADPDHPDHLDNIKKAENVKTFDHVVEEFRRRYVEKEGLRTGPILMQQVAKHLTPKFKGREFATITRDEINDALDKIEDTHGAAMAHSVLAIFRSMSKFWALRNGTYNSPFVRGMKRYKGAARKRVLNDNELRAFWIATGALGIYGSLARICLLTGQRRAKANLMQWTDLKDNIWTLDTQPREKPNCGTVHLSPLAMSILEQLPRLQKNPFVFAGERKRGPFTSFAPAQVELLKKMREIIPKMSDFTLHDLRRTFRSRCSQLRIPREIAERCLGHVIGNAIERVYDVWVPELEMRDAWFAVSAHVAGIVDPPPSSNVVPLRSGAAGAR